MFRLPSALAPALLALIHATTASGAAIGYDALFGSLSVQPSAGPSSSVGSGIAALRDATLAIGAGNFSVAENLAREVLASDGDSAEAWHMLGLALANQNRTEEAVLALESAWSGYRNNAEPKVIVGDLRREEGRIDDAIMAYEEALDRDPGNLSALEAIAGLAVARGDLAEAAEWYRLAVENSPSDRLEPVARRAAALAGSGETAAAVSVLESYVVANPTDMAARAALGQARKVAGDLTGAISDLTTASDTGLGGPVIALLLSEVQIAARRIGDAEETLSEARRLHPGNLRVLSELARVKAAVRDYEGSLAVYEEALMLAPRDKVLLKGLSAVEYRMGRFDGAIANATLLVDAPDSTSDDHIWLATLLGAAGRDDEAARAYEMAIEQDPEQWVARNNLAVLLADRDPERAVGLAAEAVELAPTVVAVQDTLGLAQYRAGDYEAAHRTLAALLEEQEYGPAVIKLGLVLIALSDDDDGRTFLMRGLHLSPDDRFAPEARAALEK